jgi:hypothetical protein
LPFFFVPCYFLAEKWRVVDTLKLQGAQLDQFVADKRESNRRYTAAFEVVLMHTPAAEMSEFWRLFGEDNLKHRGSGDRHSGIGRKGFDMEDLDIEEVEEDVNIDSAWRSSSNSNIKSRLSFEGGFFPEEGEFSRVISMGNPMHNSKGDLRGGAIDAAQDVQL